MRTAKPARSASKRVVRIAKRIHPAVKECSVSMDFAKKVIAVPTRIVRGARFAKTTNARNVRSISNVKRMPFALKEIVSKGIAKIRWIARMAKFA